MLPRGNEDCKHDWRFSKAFYTDKDRVGWKTKTCATCGRVEKYQKTRKPNRNIGAYRKQLKKRKLEAENETLS